MSEITNEKLTKLNTALGMLLEGPSAITSISLVSKKEGKVEDCIYTCSTSQGLYRVEATIRIVDEANLHTESYGDLSVYGRTETALR